MKIRRTVIVLYVVWLLLAGVAALFNPLGRLSVREGELRIEISIDTTIVNSIVREDIHPIKRLYKLLATSGIKFPDIVIAQLILETGAFKYDSLGNHLGVPSNIMKYNFNWFGQKCDASCYCIETRRGHAAYSHPLYSILGYQCWQEKRLRETLKYKGFYPRTSEEYYKFLEGYIVASKSTTRLLRYAEDPLYIRKVRYIHKKYVKPFI
jgi:hypothetical protein